MKAKKLLIQAYYGLGDEYISFPDNPHHNKTFENVDVKITEKRIVIAGESFTVDVVTISGQDPIECEVIGEVHRTDGTVVIDICQDWG